MIGVPTRRSALTARMVLIDWDKSTAPPDTWPSAEPLDFVESTQCFSVGWIIRDDWETTVLATSLAGLGEQEDLRLSGVLRIPTGSIRSVRVLEVEG